MAAEELNVPRLLASACLRRSALTASAALLLFAAPAPRAAEQGQLATPPMQPTPTASPASSVRLVRLVRQDCGSCHGLTLQGGLGTPLTAAALRGKPADSLVATILHGRPGTAMPAWKTLLSEADAQWIVARLLEGFPEEHRP